MLETLVIEAQSASSMVAGGALAAATNAVASSETARLAEGLRVSRTLASWLSARGFADVASTERFLNPRLSELTSPDTMADRGAAAERLARAVRTNEAIVVFGDYDCDGMTATAILTEMLRALGGNVTPVLASRFDGGYGLSAAALARVLAASPSVVVTCDCGSSDHERLEVLKARGIDCVVVDHHLVPELPLPALAFLNPHRRECGFPYKGLASCGLVLLLGAAVRSALGKKLELKNWLDLVAIGTIADVAPLDGDNRSLVRAGLRAIVEARRPGLKALLEVARISGGPFISAEDISFRLAPRLNAPGRLGAPDDALALMMARNAPEAESLALRLEQASVERRGQQDRINDEAVAEIERERYDEAPALVLGREGWNHGIVGIVAGRLAERYQRPVVVFGFEGGHGRGSVRGPLGSRLHDALSACASLVVRFGGHQAAAGVELSAARLAEFREAFAAAVARAEPVAAGPAAAAHRVELDPNDDPAQVLADFALLEPCGPINPSPSVVVEAKVVAARAVNGGHLKLELELDSRQRLSGFGVMMGDQAEKLSGRVRVLGRLRPDRYRGGNAVELFVEGVV